MPSAGHCGKHSTYRCTTCETKYKDTYHTDWPELVANLERQLKEAREAINKGYRDSFGNWVIPLEFVDDYLDSTPGREE